MTTQEKRDAKTALEGRRAFRAAYEQAVRAKDALPEGEDRTRTERALNAYGAEGAAPVEDVIQKGSGSVRFVRRTIVGRGDTGDPRVPGVTSGTMRDGSSWDPATQQQTVELRTRITLSHDALAGGGANLESTVAHEGSHGADHQRLHAAIVTEARDGAGLQPAIANPSIDLTKLETERDAYRVSASVAQGRYLRQPRQASTTSGGTVVYGNRSEAAPSQLAYRTGDTDHVLWDASWPEADPRADQDPTVERQNRAARRDRAIDTFLAVRPPDGLYGLTPAEPGGRLSGVAR